jgi:hypothetical protein
MRRRLAKVVKNHDAEDSEPQDTSEKQPTTEASSIIGNRKPSSLQQAFMARLSGSRFRELNEVSDYFDAPVSNIDRNCRREHSSNLIIVPSPRFILLKT